MSMYLTHLRLVNFRNHRRTDLTLGPGLQVFLGANAQGKSNLLEAVGVVATGRSHRTIREMELIRFGEGWARIRVATVRADRTTEVDVGLRRDEMAPDVARVAKELRVNGIPVRRGDLFGHVLVVAAAPEDHELVVGPPVTRRRLLDVLLAQESPSYFFAAQRYARVILHRNEVLRHARGADLAGWDEQLAALGAMMTARRRDLVQRLAVGAAEGYQALSGRTEQLVLRYAPSVAGEDEPAMMDAALRALAGKRAEELARGITLVGPHRDDLHLDVDGCALRQFGSRGQQQAAALALRLASRDVLRQGTGEEPILLLDDALLALDEQRQAYLLEHMRTGQTLLTVTAMTAQQKLGAATLYRVAGGVVEGVHADRT